jgi:arylformamidase
MNRTADITAEMIDISLPLHHRQPTWPKSTGFSLRWTQRIDRGDPVNNSHVSFDVHFGTHVDVPYHFIDNDGLTVDQVSLDAFIGPCTVIHLPNVKDVNTEGLSVLGVDPDTERLLIRTDNSRLWETGISEFRPDYTALSPDAARWITRKGIRLVGIDYLSIGNIESGRDVHRILLDSGVVVLEGLDLSRVPSGRYELVCLPLNIVGAEGAPARAILRSTGPAQITKFSTRKSS